VKTLLQEEGCVCDRFQDEATLLRALCRLPIELVIIDAGVDVPLEERILSWLNCRTGETTPVLMLSMRAAPEQVARALNAGAEDFLARPFDPLELRARARAALRRNRRMADLPTLSVGGFELDRCNTRVRHAEVPAELTSREFAMAWLFFSNPNECLSRETISLSVWAIEADIAARTIEQHVYKLRKKLQLDGRHGVTLRTCYSQGYRLEVSRVEAPIPVVETIAMQAVAPVALGRALHGPVRPGLPVRAAVAGLAALPLGFFSGESMGLAGA